MATVDQPGSFDHCEETRMIPNLASQLLNFHSMPNCQVIYSQFGLAIHPNDHQARRRFVEWAQNEIAVVPDFHKRILFSDEAPFWLNGYVNKKTAAFGVKLIHKCMSKHRYIQKN
ncbi:hypothetical protein TNCV_3660561 [Trichonephila clavipes]|nr:hypothetical protein TNCV_3660561 [Trichonephila clavipes]